MAKKLYVGSLPYEADDSQLEELFSKIGKVASATVIKDKFSGKSKGFGFVEMETEEDAKKAISELNGSTIGERTIVVNEAKPMREKRDFKRF